MIIGVVKEEIWIRRSETRPALIALLMMQTDTGKHGSTSVGREIKPACASWSVVSLPVTLAWSGWIAGSNVNCVLVI